MVLNATSASGKPTHAEIGFAPKNKIANIITDIIMIGLMIDVMILKIPWVSPSVSFSAISRAIAVGIPAVETTNNQL